MTPRSLRWRLQIWHALLLVAVLVIFGGTVYGLQWKTRLHQIDADLDRTADVLSSRAHRLFPPPQFRWPGFGQGNRVGAQAGAEGGRRPRPRGTERPLPPGEGKPPADLPREPRLVERPPADLPAGERAAPDRLPTEAAGPERHVAERSFGDLPDEIAQLFTGSEDSRQYYVLWNRDGDILTRSDAQLDIPFPDLHAGQDRVPVKIARTRDGKREVVHVSRFGTNILVGRALEADIAAQHRTGLALAGIGLGVLVVGLLGGWWFTSRAIRPIAAMTATARSISARDLSHRIDVAGTDNELGELAVVLNQTFDRIEQAFQQQTRFTADASHELRTPMAVILANTELALSKPRSEGEYREALEACRRASQRMKSLIESLLVLARFDSGASSLNASRLNLALLAQETTALVSPLADQRKITLEFTATPAEARGDRERLGQVLTNLLTNAIRYNREGGTVRVNVATDGAFAVLTVSDDGIGIPPEHLPHIFERFYRVDPARARSDGGSGLGLSICKTIVEAHGGTISARSEPNVGTTMEVRLPRVEPAGRERDSELDDAGSNRAAERVAPPIESELAGTSAAG